MPMNSDILRTPRWERHTRVIPASAPETGDTSVRHQLSTPLRLSVHDYHISDSSKGGVTAILTHGTSFNKYFWELIVDGLVDGLAARGLQGNVKRLIALDAANHGDSAVLNKGALPATACWQDDSRDILQVLKWLRVDEPALGIGHSFGGGALCHAAMMDPVAFTATIFIEPILFQMEATTKAIAALALKRRDRWESKADVAAAFTKNKAFQDWDKRQLQVFIEHGTAPLEAGNDSSPRKLKTPKEQESATYLAAPYPDILVLLSQSRGTHHFIWGSKSKVISDPDRESVERIVRHPSTSQVVPGVGHLIPMTHPETLARMLIDRLAGMPWVETKGKL